MGHVQHKGKVYVGRYTGKDGRERSKSFPLHRQATAWFRKQEADMAAGTWVDPDFQKVTVGELVQTYVDKAAKPDTKSARQFCHNNLGPLEGVPVGKLTALDVDRWLASLTSGREWAKGSKLSPSSAKNAFAVLRAVLNYAVILGILPRSPAAGISAPKVSSRAVTRGHLLTMQQVDLVAKAASKTVAVMVLVQAASGLRPGELCGLRVRSVNLERRELHVTEQATRTSDPTVWKALKTDGSVRDVPIPDVTVALLRGHLATRTGASGDEPLFTTRYAGMYTATTYGKQFVSAADAVGVAGFTPHDLRHFYASGLIFQGLSVATVQAMLGHASPTETLRTYTHLWPKPEESIRKAVEAILTV